MSLSEKLEVIRKESVGQCGSGGVLLWELIKITQEMAKRIEALEQRELGHIERVGKLLLDNDQG